MYRDYNAALNILDAAGLAESLNAHGDGIRLRLASAKRSSRQGSANPTGGTLARSALGIPVLMLKCHKVAYKKLICSPTIPNKHC